ncbi:O-antigen ligase family protein [Desulfobotulus mexicanus]|uniref:O-antigen ligase family protein n=1 Tax=Desulfobotulus mexicanus TaxID=2586642 RepID=A0A5Q4VIV7_9BACT|nr:hypothetical protein [Desulfobotulus mexicanus]TYT76147.1 hypothetical protein FIM25_00915 [Desulfobotulus mexicanus]
MIRAYNLLFALFVCINLHLLRNLSMVLMFGLIGSLYIVLFFGVLNQKTLMIKTNHLYFSYLLFILFSFYVVFISAFTHEASDFLNGFLRFFLLMPMGIFGYLYINNEEQVRKILIFYAVFIAVSCSTVPLQHFIGPINWFSSVFERAGMPRYSSLMGSVTVTGIAGGAGLVVLLLLSNINSSIRFGLVLSILVGMIFSLQKASLVNILLAFFIYLWFSGKISKCVLVRSLLKTLFILVLLMVFIIRSEVAEKYLIGFMASNFSETITSDQKETAKAYYDYTLLESMGQRLVLLPKKVLHAYGEEILIVGAGFKAMAGTLAQEGPMNHNGFFDLWFSGGIVYLLIFLVLIFYLIKQIKRAVRFSVRSSDSLMQNNLYCFYGLLIMILINNFGANTLFQPNTGVIFWLFVGILAGHYNRKLSYGRMNLLKKSCNGLVCQDK